MSERDARLLVHPAKLPVQKTEAAGDTNDTVEQIAQALDNGAFELYYQPKVHMRSGDIIGMEALIRWRHPQKGMLLPNAFLPAVAGHPLSVELGEWVLQHALEQLVCWRRGGHEWHVSINIGAWHFQQQGFASRLAHVLKAFPELKPESIVLEIVEEYAFNNLPQTVHTIKACVDLGIRLTFDNYGAGYVSLASLKRLPLYEVKIDHGFVMNMHDDPEDLSIMIGILGLAKTFGVTPVAKGVETIEEGVTLLQLGCELAQGFCIARPMPVEMLDLWCREWRASPKWRKQHPLGSDFHQVIYAKVNHAVWIRKLAAYLLAPTQATFPTENHACDFDVWLSRARQMYKNDGATLDTIGELHEAIHAYAQKLIGRISRGEDGGVEAGMERIRQMHDALIGELDNLLGTIRPFSL